MGEVGDQGPAFHAEVGAYAAECGIEAFYTLGDLCLHAGQAFGAAHHFDNMDSLLAALAQHAVQFQSIVVKGSRFMKMERVVEALQALANGQEHNKKGEAHAA
jgi:UDP-N-acetylmuramoyl-tripeptide--D-alanyl-D-alanine ligase